MHIDGSGFPNEAHERKPDRGHHRGAKEGQTVAPRKPVAVQHPSGDDRHENHRDTGTQVACPLQPSPPSDGHRLRKQQVEHDHLHATRQAPHHQHRPDQEHRDIDRRKQGQQGQHKNLQPHQTAEQHRGPLHVAAVLGQRRAQQRRHEHSQALAGRSRAHRQTGAGQQVDVGRQEGRRLEQAEPGHAEQAMGEQGGVVTPPVEAAVTSIVGGHAWLAEGSRMGPEKRHASKVPRS